MDRYCPTLRPMTKTGLLTITATDAAAVNSALRSVLAQQGTVAIVPANNSLRSQALLRAIAPTDPVPPGIGLITTTSGSTSTPKGVLIGYNAINASIDAVNQELGFTPQWHLVLPLQHIAGTMTAIRGLAPDSQLHQPTINAADPMQLAAYAKSVKDLSGLHAITLVPEHLNRLAIIDELASLRFFHKVIVGAGSIDVNLRIKMLDLGIPIVSSYGLTETCGGIVWDGLPLNSVSISLNESGEVLVQSEMNATGYRNSSEDLTIINTHDLGNIDSGKLQLVGRSDNKVKIKGHFVDLLQLNELVSSYTEREAVSLVVDDELHLIITNPETKTEELLQNLIDQLGSGLKGCKVHLREKLPRTELGKIDMFSLRVELASD